MRAKKQPAGRRLTIPVLLPTSPEPVHVSAISIRPRDARWLYLIGHGAGAGMDHLFFLEITSRLSRRGIATLRYQFPYMEAGRKLPDRAPVLQATVRAVLARARTSNARARRPLPIVVGGKSMGGRMSSLTLAADLAAPGPASSRGSGSGPSHSRRRRRSRAAAVEALGVHGVAFLGFPLYPAGKPPPAGVSPERAEHLEALPWPMLFVQGTRDKLADLDRVRALSRALGRRARLHVVEGGDHSFEVLKRSGRVQAEVYDEVAEALAAWGERVVE